MINWSKGIVARYYATMVNPNTWRDIEEFEIFSGSITYSNSGIRNSADISCRNFDHENEHWIRIYLKASQSGESEKTPLFTGLASSPDYSYDGRIEESKIQCDSVLSTAEHIYLDLGWYAKAGTNGAIAVRDLLSDVTPAPIVIDGVSQTLSQNIVAEENETNLSMADKILEAINWRIYLEGNGTIHIAPFNTEPVAIFDHRENDILEKSINIDNNWNEIPNVFRAVGSGISSIARDERANSKYSIQNRGREIWAQETNCQLNDGEKISDYAQRRLNELQEVNKNVDYVRRFIPGINIDDYVWLNYPEQKLSGLFKVESQTLNLSYGGTVSEKVVGK